VANKRCRACKEIKPANHFPRNRGNGDGLFGRCIECERWFQRYKKYGISRKEYEAKFFEQDGKCAICRVPSTGQLHVDHCHTVNKVRGLLCFNCNAAIGLFKDDPLMLQAAIAYIQKWKTP
jgi:hypothetical protein